MNVNINLKHKKSFIKKIIILILFTLFCFFIKENVFALSVPSFLENYTDLRVSCDNDFELCISNESHTFKSFMEYYIMLTHRYVLIVEKDCDKTYCISSDGTDYTGVWYGMYFFSEKPYLDCSGSICLIYTSKNATTHSTFYYTLNNHSLSSDGYQYLEFYKGSTDSTSDYYHSNNTKPMYFVPLYSNFDIEDIDGNLVFSNNSTGESDWNDTEDIPRPDNRNWFQKLGDSITEGFYNLGKFFVELPNNIVNGIKDLFVPGDELEGFFEEEYEFLQTKLGFLIYPITVLVDFANRIYDLSNSSNAVFNIPNVSFMGINIIKAQSFDLYSLVQNNEVISNFYRIYRIVVSGFIVFWLIELANKKRKQIF